MALDYEEIFDCLEEVERELLRVGGERCDFLQRKNQLSAVILLLLRSASLFRTMTKLLRSEELDAFDAVRRAFLESWHLAFQFRLSDARGQVGRWLAGTPQSWSADIGRLETYARQRGQDAPNLGQDYGGLSELAHPTRSATENSAALIVRRLGMSELEEAQTIESSIRDLELSLSAMLYRLLWLVLDEHSDLLALHVDSLKMSTCVRFAENYPRSREPKNRTHPTISQRKGTLLLLTVVVAGIASLIGLSLFKETKAAK